MALTTTTEVHPDYLKATVEGEWALSDVFGLIDQLKAEADRVGRTCILVDFRGVEPQASVMDQYDTGGYIAEKMRFRYKIACVEPVRAAASLKKVVATSRGADINVLPTEDEAVAWLLQ